MSNHFKASPAEFHMARYDQLNCYLAKIGYIKAHLKVIRIMLSENDRLKIMTLTKKSVKLSCFTFAYYLLLDTGESLPSKESIISMVT